MAVFTYSGKVYFDSLPEPLTPSTRLIWRPATTTLAAPGGSLALGDIDDIDVDASGSNWHGLTLTVGSDTYVFEQANTTLINEWVSGNGTVVPGPTEAETLAANSAFTSRFETRQSAQSRVDTTLPFLNHQGLDASVGEETMPRLAIASSSVQHASGTLRFGFFTARSNITVTQARTRVSATAAAATPTMIRFGLYALDSAGNGTLVASTPNDTTLFAAATTAYAKAFSTPYTLVKDTRYAMGLIIVTAATAPTFYGLTTAIMGNLAPRVSGFLSGQTDLPSTFTDAGLSDSLNLAWWAATV